MKFVFLAGALIVIGGGWLIWGGHHTPSGDNPASMKSQSTSTEKANMIDFTKAIPTGTYVINADKSVVNWAAKKPLIEGYINSGTIGITSGTVTVAANGTTGLFTMNMHTLDVGLTAKKPGQEGKLEEHLKGERFFNVAAFPTATFTITQVTPIATPTAEQTHTLMGDLTLKGQKVSVSFPAMVYAEGGILKATATTNIDRTKWGITANSKNFFENLGDNMIDDMVGLSISLEATKQ